MTRKILERVLAIFLLACGCAWGQAQPPSAYPAQIITYQGAPFGVCDVYQVALNVSNGTFMWCNPSTRAWTNPFSGTPNFTQGLIAPTIGPSAAQQHTIPAVTSDTFGLLAATQTFSGLKTFSQQITSTVSTGTAPFSIASTTQVTNLNAQLHGGLSAPASAIVGISDTQTLTNKSFGTGSAAASNWTYLNGNVGGINPTGSTDGLALGWNFSNGGADSDFFAVRNGVQTGGFRFYDWNGTTATLLVTIPTTAVGNIVGDTGTQTLSNKTLTRVQAGTTAPTCSVTGAGTGATCSIQSSSNDNSGNMQINTGTSPGTSGTWTLTFNASWPNAGFCSVSLGNANTTLNARATVFNNSNGAAASQSGNWDNNGVAPTASQATAFLINYVCIGH